MLNVSAVTSDHHLRDLRRLYDQLEANIRSLKALGVESESYGAMLSSVLLNKLPPELRLIVSRSISTDDLDIDKLLKIFKGELIARERANNSVSSVPRQVQNQSRSSTSAFNTTVRVECVFCQKSHASVDCTTVLEIEARKGVLRSSGRCFNCLRKNHLSKNCHSTSRCRHCQGKHHTSICEKKKESSSLATPTKFNPEAATFSPDVTTSTLCTTQTKTILMQTARAIVYNPLKPRMTVEVRLLFDSGSQRSYMSERAMKLLQLEPSGEQALSISTFGTTKERTKVCPVVSVGVHLKGYPNASLSLYVVPTICEPLTGQTITATIEADDKLMSLDLADIADGTSCLPVDVLIGCDHYWDLVTGSICRSETGPTAIQTKLGWVLSGPTTTVADSERSSAHVVTTHLLRVDTQSMESSQLTEQLRSFWELESLGVHEEEATLYDEFASNITFQEGRYEVSLPWSLSPTSWCASCGQSYHQAESSIRCLL